MKRTIIFSAFMVFVLAGVSSGQSSPVRLTFSEAIGGSGVPTGTVTFTGLEGPTVRVFEAIIPATTESACFASTDFSAARPVGPDRASVSYDPVIGSYQLKWTSVRDKRDSCRVLLVGQSAGASDLAMWQSNYGSSGLIDTALPQGSYGRGTYQIRLAPSSTPSRLSVKYPARDGEVIELGFAAPANSNFRLFETSFPSRSDAECVANTDFSAATPVGNDRATIGYYPATGIWFLKNTNPTVPTVQCHALFIDGDNTVDAGDFAVWRTNFGSTLLAEGGESFSDAGSLDGDARQPTYRGTVTFTYMVLNPGITDSAK